MNKSQRHSLVVLQCSLFAFGIIWLQTVLDESVRNSTGCTHTYLVLALFSPFVVIPAVYILITLMHLCFFLNYL